MNEALRELEAAHKVRRGDDGYRIPTPAEDDWELVRNGISPRPSDAHKLYSEVLAGFWQPQPTHSLQDAKTFKAGLAVHGREIVGGDLVFHLHLAAELADLLARETFHRDLPAIEQHARAIQVEYTRRFDDAQQARIDAYTRALEQLTSEPGWHELREDTQREIAAPLVAGQQPRPRTAPISLLRSDRDACEARLRTAIRRLREIVEGERLAEVEVRSYFVGGIETEEQLDAALSGLREECTRLIGAGKRVVVS